MPRSTSREPSHCTRGTATGAPAAMSMQWLGLTVARRGDLRRALELYGESLRLLGAVMDPTVQTLDAIRILSARHQLDEPGDHVGAIEGNAPSGAARSSGESGRSRSR